MVFAAWNFYRGRTNVTAVLASIGILMVLLGLAIPSFARRFHAIWMRFASALGWVNSRVLLGLLFYIVLAPYNLLGRLIKRDPLTRRGRGRNSYWIKRKQTRQTREQFERSF